MKHLKHLILLCMKYAALGESLMIPCATFVQTAKAEVF